MMTAFGAHQLPYVKCGRYMDEVPRFVELKRCTYAWGGKRKHSLARVPEVAQVIANGGLMVAEGQAEGQGRRPAPKARAEGAIENVGLFGRH